MTSENTPPKPMNARERRRLKREQAQTQKEKQTTKEVEQMSSKGSMTPDQPTISPSDEMKTNKKRKRRSRDTSDTATTPKKLKRIHLTLFVGQLPYTTTREMLQKHFEEAGEIEIRMLTDKKTNRFRGMAFIEVQHDRALGAALAQHHTLLNGRRINVELTANGGGMKSELRKNRIQALRQKQSEKQHEKTAALVKKRVESSQWSLNPADLDERAVDFLSWFDYETAKKALDEFEKSVSDRIKNRPAFFMGILKRFRTTDGENDQYKLRKSHSTASRSEDQSNRRR